MPTIVLKDENAHTCDALTPLRLQDGTAESYALQLKAMSHPVRLQMLDVISQGGGEVCGCDIENHFALTQPTISHHLKVLRDAGLIVSEPRGVWVYHRINSTALDGLHALLTLLRPTETE